MGQEQTKTALDRARRRHVTNLIPALALVAWEAKRRPGLASGFGYGVSEFDGWRGFWH